MAYLKSSSITIDRNKCGTADSTNFPMLFYGTYADLAGTGSGGSVQNASGFDIIFSSTPDLSGAGILAFELVNYDNTTGAIEAWVQIPTLSVSTDTVIWVIYDNSAITTDQSNAATVWSSYIGVWHFGTSSSLVLTDSTGSSTATNHGATAVAGQIAGGAAFVSGSSQWIDTGLTPTSVTDFTLEFWANPSNYNFQFLMDSGTAGSGGISSAMQTAQEVTIGYRNGTNFFDRQNNIPLSAWSHVAGTHTGGVANQITLYINGSPITGHTSNTGSPTNPSNGGTLQLGREGGAASFFNTGSLDEVRVSKSVRSASWILAGYNNQKSPKTFYSVGLDGVNVRIAQLPVQVMFSQNNPNVRVGHVVVQVLRQRYGSQPQVWISS